MMSLNDLYYFDLDFAITNFIKWIKKIRNKFFD